MTEELEKDLISREEDFIEELQARETGIDYEIKRLAKASTPGEEIYKKEKVLINQMIQRHRDYLEWLKEGAPAPTQNRMV